MRSSVYPFFYNSFFVCVCLLCAATPAFAQSKQSNALQVKINSGFIEGVPAGGGIISYKGIPFAAPPVGPLRWKAPQPVAPWAGVKLCTAFGPSPMQAPPAPFSMWTKEFLIPTAPISEDCLYLNVWSGSKSPGEKKPVLVWIYGGGFASGGSGVPIYDGTALAQKGLVFVSINYRVGIFGFFAHPELTAEGGTGASGNYGLLDQIAALKWVQQNIAAFGGDPGNVTIAGQSAGAMSVNCLVASPLASGLFQKAIAQSGASFTRNNPPLQEAEQDGLKTATALGATSLAALRQLSSSNLLKATQEIRGPIVDGSVLPQAIAAIFAAGTENNVALLTGWNEDEGLLFGPVKNATDFKKQLVRQYGPAADTVLRYYPAATDAEAATAQLHLSRDMIFGLQNYAWATAQSKQKRSAFVYRFARKVPATGEYVKYGAFHTGEVPYAYNNLRFVKRPWQPGDKKLAALMATYWVNFITTGNPNGSGLPPWPAYTNTEKQIMRFDVESKSARLPDAAALEFMYRLAMQQ